MIKIFRKTHLANQIAGSQSIAALPSTLLSPVRMGLLGLSFKVTIFLFLLLNLYYCSRPAWYKYKHRSVKNYQIGSKILF